MNNIKQRRERQQQNLRTMDTSKRRRRQRHDDQNTARHCQILLPNYLVVILLSITTAARGQTDRHFGKYPPQRAQQPKNVPSHKQQQQQQQQQQHQQQQNVDSPQQSHDSRRQLLQQRKTETLSRWNRFLQEGSNSGGDTRDGLRPLDLVLSEDVDPATGLPRVYQVGKGGFLEPYDMENYQRGRPGADVSVSGGGSGSGSGGGGEERGDGGSNGGTDDRGHQESGRMKSTNFDIQRLAALYGQANGDRAEATERGRKLRGNADATAANPNNLNCAAEDCQRGLLLDQRNKSPFSVPSSSLSSIFIYDETDPEDLDAEVDPEILFSLAESVRGRRLQTYMSLGTHSKSSEVEVSTEDRTRSSAGVDSGYAASFADPNTDTVATTATTSTTTSTNTTSSTTTTEEASIAEIQAQGSKKDDKTAPVIRSTFPPPGTIIGYTQSFGCLASDDPGGTGVKNVCVQFKDAQNKRSSCFKLNNIKTRNSNTDEEEDSDIWELTFDGFEAYAGEEWQVRFKGRDKAKNKDDTKWSDFIINIGDRENVPTPSPTEVEDHEDEGDGDDDDDVYEAPPAPGTPLLEEVRDENWPYEGVVKTTTGRILFFINSSPYVCTGTVLKPPDGVATNNDRTIILTAAHCAYQYSPYGGQFAEHALFIPDQDDTRGGRTNDICGDDPMGCWIPAFAVVDRRWTEMGFPNSVPYDYAYYNDAAVHEQGYLADIPDILDEAVEPLPVNFHFNEDISNYNFFTHGLGYSFNKDPNFRYCSTDVSTKFGIQTYENLWLDICDMTGGSSGGPWMVDVDTNGRGTVVSVNSWGYSSSSGMAGPDLSTEKGSLAECLYQRARDTPFDNVSNGGLIVPDCDPQ
ncbi:hypothetical protein ACHAXS_014132 [Conticribra weissflogii]